MRKLVITLALMLSVICATAAPKTYELKSPNGRLKVTVKTSNGLGYTLEHDCEVLLQDCRIGMSTDFGGSIGGIRPVKGESRRSGDRTILTVAYKKSHVDDFFNEMVLRFRTFSLVFRAYDEGVAYRFVSHIEGPYNIDSERAEFNFPEDWNAWVPYVSQNTEELETQYFNSFESRYEYTPITKWNKNRLAFLPLMIEGPNGKKIVITESDLNNYPGMYLYNERGKKKLQARFPQYPKQFQQGGHNNLQLLVDGRRYHIASCHGMDSFPWRIIIVSDNDAQLLENDMVYRLSDSPDFSTDWSWVKPGKVAWDWWNAWNIDGVDFKSGINNDTYKYYIDFAAANGIEYIILDEGWCVEGAADLFQIVPEIDLPLLVDYAKERNVGIILWAGYWAFDREMEAVCKFYSEMGIKGFKVDFMDRDDQIMTNFHARAAETTAKYKLLIDFHGTYKPTGLHKTYPNVLNYEGVHGLEQMKWSGADVDQVKYDVTMPFIRMVAGPVDYTQGAMRNAKLSNYHAVYDEPMSQGTRCRQLAEYVVFDSPLTMMCDSPSAYMREQECTDFIVSVPTVWDETIGIDGKVGEYVAVARRSGDVWYVGAMTDWSPRLLDLRLDFLENGDYEVEIFKDGTNADKIARDYRRMKFDCVVEGGSMYSETAQTYEGCLSADMAPGGGFVARIVRK